MRRLAMYGFLAVAVLFSVQSAAVADPPTDLGDWLTWTVYDAKGDQISLSSYQNQSTYVVLFSPSCKESCDWMRALADYMRAHPNHTGKVLCMCTDDSGAKAVKLHLRQEEWKKRVADWEAAQETAKAAAATAGEPFVPEAMPDFLAEIKDELEDPDDLAGLMAYHLPCKTGCRCDAMWKWLQKRMATPRTVPRAFKFSSNGTELNEWSTPPQQVSTWLSS
jgi:hypothetical protein